MLWNLMKLFLNEVLLILWSYEKNELIGTSIQPKTKTLPKKFFPLFVWRKQYILSLIFQYRFLQIKMNLIKYSNLKQINGLIVIITETKKY